MFGEPVQHGGKVAEEQVVSVGVSASGFDQRPVDAILGCDCQGKGFVPGHERAIGCLYETIHHEVVYRDDPHHHAVNDIYQLWWVLTELNRTGFPGDSISWEIMESWED